LAAGAIDTAKGRSWTGVDTDLMADYREVIARRTIVRAA